MEKPALYPTYKNPAWSNAWANPTFRKKSIGALIVFISIVLFLPHFFSVIEARPGIVLNDLLLLHLPAKDFSLLIFLFVWSTSILIIIRSVQQPAIFLLALGMLIVITLCRIVTISVLPLDAPIGLIPLSDPLTNLTYGGSQIFITKDLFFSGHTSNLFMFYLCLQKKRDKQFALFATLMVGMLVLVQHVHYTIDVAGAFIFTWLIVFFAKKSGFFTIK